MTEQDQREQLSFIYRNINAPNRLVNTSCLAVQPGNDLLSHA